MAGKDRERQESIDKLEREIEGLDLESEMREIEREGDRISVIDTLDGQEIFTAESSEEKTEGEGGEILFKVDKNKVDYSTLKSVSSAFGEKINLSVSGNTLDISASPSVAGAVAGRLGGVRTSLDRRPVRGFRETRIWGKIHRLSNKWRNEGLTGRDVAYLNHLLTGEQKRDAELASPLRWISPGAIHFNTQRMRGEYERLESTEKSREKRIAEIAGIPRQEITEVEKKELRKLEHEEMQRTWLRGILEARLGEKELKKISGGYDTGIPEGGFGRQMFYGIKPGMRITHWDLIDQKARDGAMWYYDNALLRVKAAMMQSFKMSGLWWVRAEFKTEAEKLFEDVDEEIYAWKTFEKGVKTRRKELEDMEEELMGYDRFTVEEESRIKKSVQEEMKELKQYEHILANV